MSSSNLSSVPSVVGTSSSCALVYLEERSIAEVVVSRCTGSLDRTLVALVTACSCTSVALVLVVARAKSES